MGKVVDHVGTEYGWLTVRENVGKNKHRQSLWLCECRCGNFITAVGASVKGGSSKSCGCSRRERLDRTGLRYGKLIARQRHTYRDKGGNTLWLCECDCGNFITARGSELQGGRAKNCGCVRRTAGGLSHTPMYQREQRRRRKYNMAFGDYKIMYANQGAKCLVCEEVYDLLQVDHCHSTGKVRGLLCGPCNRALGLVKEDRKIILAMHEYLKGE